MSEELVEWLRARLDEDERVAKECRYQEWTHDGGSIYSGHPTNEIVDWVYDEAGWDHIARHDPARVLREVESKRRLLKQFELRGNSVRAVVKPSTGGVWDDLLRMLTLPYSDRPGYQESWRS